MSTEHLVERRFEIDPATAELLEGWFCEEYQTNWLLHEDERTKVHELRGYFPDAASADQLYDELRQLFPSLPDNVGSERIMDDKDWREAYKLHFKPWHYGNLHFVPVWERESYVVPAGHAVIWLDPGMAFGTGNHETTRLCLYRLLDLAKEWGADKSSSVDVIDAGCGSGILSLAARKAGFGQVLGFDLDPDSVRISLENSELCETSGTVEFLWANLEDGFAQRTADVVLANILANVLCQYSTLLLNAVRLGGALILSGILAKERLEVLNHFLAAAKTAWGGVAAHDSRVEGEWADVFLRR